MATSTPHPRTAAWPSVVADALGEPSGASWHRVSLQVNPYSYVGKSAPKSAYPDEASYNSAIVRGCLNAGVSMIGVTDHWCVRSAAGLLDAAQEAGIIALPGFEAVSQEGIHLLILFERGTELGVLDAAIGDCGAWPGADFERLGKPMTEILTIARSRNALAIPAHANGKNGLLTVLQGRALADAWRNDELRAVCVSPHREVAPVQRRILDNAEHEYRRRHRIAELHSDDVCEPSRIADESGSCWVKMSTPSLAALDLATRTPETRVRLADPHEVAPPSIVTISWQGGFLDGVRVHFSRSLTCFVGGRGTGKSTVVESIRYALGVDPIGAGARRDQRGLVEGVLGAGVKITMLVHGPDGEFVLERTVPDPPVVRDASGTALASRPIDVLGPVEVFGQHELAELADSPDYVAKLLRRLAGSDTPGSTVGTRLGRNREAIVSANLELANIDDALDELPRLEEALAQFRGARLDERLEERSRIDRERQILDAAGRRIDDLLDAGAPLRSTELLAPMPLPPDLVNPEIVGRIDEVVSIARDGRNAALAALDDADRRARAALTAVDSDWAERTADVRERYESALRHLRADGHDASRYVATQQAVQRMAPLTEQRARLDARRQALYEDRRQLLAELTEQEGDERRRLGRAASEAVEPVKKTVRVHPHRSPDRSAIVSLVESGVRGQRSQIKDAIAREDFSPQALAKAARRGSEALEDFGIRGAQASNLAAAGEELFLRLEEMTVGNAVAISLNLATEGTPDFRPLDQLSKGQKATALLLLLLAAARGPLVVDQPEDDLDNRFVWEGIVPRLREVKGSRQLVFSTHNANIPVLGDAELVVVMEPHGQRHGRVAEGGVGSLDDRSVLSLAESVLEGGPEAFHRRRYLYGF